MFIFHFIFNRSVILKLLYFIMIFFKLAWCICASGRDGPVTLESVLQYKSGQQRTLKPAWIIWCKLKIWNFIDGIHKCRVFFVKELRCSYARLRRLYLCFLPFRDWLFFLNKGFWNASGVLPLLMIGPLIKLRVGMWLLDLSYSESIW